MRLRRRNSFPLPADLSHPAGGNAAHLDIIHFPASRRTSSRTYQEADRMAEVVEPEPLILSPKSDVGYDPQTSSGAPGVCAPRNDEGRRGWIHLFKGYSWRECPEQHCTDY